MSLTKSKYWEGIAKSPGWIFSCKLPAAEKPKTCWAPNCLRAKILARYDRQRAVTISARLIGDYTLTEALGFLEKIVDKNTPEAMIEWKWKSE